MPSIIRQYGGGSSLSSSRGSKHQKSNSVIDAVAFSSQSTAPTSVSSGSPHIPDSKCVPAPAGHPPSYNEPSRPRTAQRSTFQPSHQAYEDDLSPSTLCYPRASVDTYVSNSDSEDEDENAIDDTFDITDDDDDAELQKHYLHTVSHKASLDANAIPPLPEYRPDICGGISSMHYSTTPQEFAQLFPSLNRMSIRHDETTADGNMNLRVDIIVPVGERRRLTSYQLFHLRMYDLAKREFSLRRYGRDSGREVCSSKLNFIDPAGKKEKKSRLSVISRKSDENYSSARHWDRRSSSSSSHSAKTTSHLVELCPSLQRSVATALRSLSAIASVRPSFGRRHSSTSRDHNRQRPATSHSPYTPHSTSPTSSARPSLSSSAPSFFVREKGHIGSSPVPAPKPTNTVKFEFSNYARVDLVRVGSASSSTTGHGHSADNIRYEFEWWGHKYAWKRSTDRLLNTVSYHLMRDNHGETPIAHIVPEMRSPNQIDADKDAGGWIPPCHMWISDPSVLDAETDVADVIMSTGLIALTDDCIRMRWPSKASTHAGHGFAFDMEHVGPRALMQHVFHRRGSNSSGHTTGASHHMSRPLRHADAVY